MYTDPPSPSEQKRLIDGSFQRAARRRARGEFPSDSRHTRAIWELLAAEEKQGWWEPPRRPGRIESEVGR